MNTHLIIAFLAAVVGVACALVWPSVPAPVPASGRGAARWGRLVGWAVAVPRVLAVVSSPARLVGAPSLFQPAPAGLAGHALANLPGRASQIPSRLPSPSSVRTAFRRIL